jgi:uncharacterized protein (DUF4415 family)
MKKPSRRPRPRKRSGKVTDDTVVYRPGMADRTNWDAVKRMTDEEIDRQIHADPDVAPAVDESWMADAELVVPEKKEGVYLRLDPDVLAFFKAPGRGYQTRINTVLKSYVRAHRRPRKASR